MNALYHKQSLHQVMCAFTFSSDSILSCVLAQSSACTVGYLCKENFM